MFHLVVQDVWTMRWVGCGVGVFENDPLSVSGHWSVEARPPQLVSSLDQLLEYALVTGFQVTTRQLSGASHGRTAQFTLM